MAMEVYVPTLFVTSSSVDEAELPLDSFVIRRTSVADEEIVSVGYCAYVVSVWVVEAVTTRSR